MQLIAQQTLDSVMDDHFDMIILPGGLPGADNLNSDHRIISLLQKSAKEKVIVAAICAAPKVLVTAGLLDNKKATSFPGILDNKPAKGMHYSKDSVVIDGNVVTSRGPGTAIDFSLALLEILMDKKVRDTVEKSLIRSYSQPMGI